MKTTYEIKILELANGRQPYSEWIFSLDNAMKVQVVKRIERIKNGNWGDHKQIESNLYELKIDKGPGYRVYFTKKGNKIVILLTGGNKRTQKKDIEKAKEYLKTL